MAKDKEFEKEYKIERSARTKVRKAKRREKRLEDQRRYGGVCPRCGHRLNDCEDDW